MGILTETCHAVEMGDLTETCHAVEMGILTETCHAVEMGNLTETCHAVEMGDLTVGGYEDGGAMPLLDYPCTLLEWKLCAQQLSV